jgi:NAD(P)-dependent dehydrogenase (short-subunit alcohol dehydrogenase family)
MTETSHEQATTEGKVVLVTGASSGIGEATALLLAQNRARAERAGEVGAAVLPAHVGVTPRRHLRRR